MLDESIRTPGEELHFQIRFGSQPIDRPRHRADWTESQAIESLPPVRHFTRVPKINDLARNETRSGHDDKLDGTQRRDHKCD